MNPPDLLPNPPAPESFDLASAVKGKAPSVDSNGDGSLDGVLVDTNNDGSTDALAIDSNADKVLDKLVRDLDRDGLYEATVEMPTKPPPSGEPTACKVEFSVKTEDYGGKYKEKNAGVIWITDGEGKFIRTLEVWAGRRANHLHIWLDGTGGDRADAITGATLTVQKLHVVTWDCTAKDGAVLPYGKYIAHIEFTSNSSQGLYMTTPFDRGADPAQFNTPPAEGFPMGATVTYQPSN